MHGLNGLLYCNVIWKGHHVEVRVGCNGGGVVD